VTVAGRMAGVLMVVMTCPFLRKRGTTVPTRVAWVVDDE